MTPVYQSSRVDTSVSLRYHAEGMNCAAGDANPGMTTTPRCTLALTYAEQSLTRFSHSRLTGAHLILGLMMLRNGIPFNVLTQSGLSIESVEGYLSSLRLSPEETTKRDNMRLGKSVRLALERAAACARSHHTYVLGDRASLPRHPGGGNG